MNDPHDNELRARFQAQRRTEANEAPPFASMMERARATAGNAAPRIRQRRPNWRDLVYIGGLAAAAAIAALIVIPRGPSSEDAFEQAVRRFQNDPALGAWQSPTDGLLEVPGSQLITTVPSVGTGAR